MIWWWWWWWNEFGDGDHKMMVLWLYDGSRFIRVGHNGRVSYSQRLTVTARCRMDLSKFPHDSQVTKSKGRGSNLFDPICLQICPLKISSFGHDKSQVTLHSPNIFHGKENVFFFVLRGVQVFFLGGIQVGRHPSHPGRHWVVSISLHQVARRDLKCFVGLKCM